MNFIPGLFMLALDDDLLMLVSHFSYVNMIQSSLGSRTRNFSEYLSICNRYFADYIKPIVDDEVSAKETSKLFYKFQPKLQEITNYFLCDHKVVGLKSSIEMSPSMSYLLIGSFLASYNSTKNDKKLFVRNQGRVRSNKRAKTIDLEPRPPKMFTLERMFNIYQALLNLNEMDNKMKHNLMLSSLVLQQFNELIKLNLVYPAHSAAASISSSAKYFVSDIVSLDQIKELARGIQLDLTPFIENVF